MALAFVLLGAGCVNAQSQPPSPAPFKAGQVPQKNSNLGHHKSYSKQRGTENTPLVVKVVPPQPTEEEAQRHASEHQKEASRKRRDHLFTGLVAGANAIMALFTVLLWRSTEKLWDAAQEQSGITKNALIGVERAFVFLEDVELRYVGTEGWSGGDWRILPRLKNSGTTPTKNARVCISMMEFGPEIPDNYEFPDSWLGTKLEPMSILIGPQASVVIETPNESSSLFRHRGKRMLMWGWIDYDDIFPDTKRHRTEFCVEIMSTINPDSDWRSRIVDNGTVFFRYRFHWAYNGADDDCLKRPTAYVPEVPQENTTVGEFAT